MPLDQRPAVSTNDCILDLAGVGIGPFNLSIAALVDGLDPSRRPSCMFFDKRPRFDWHPGLMLPDVELQSSFLKDLVTPVDPTNPWSFIAFLVAHRRLFTYLNAQYFAVPRKEMANYFAWVTRNLEGLSFGTPIGEIDHDGESFVLTSDKQPPVRARNIVIGTGTRPFQPEWAHDLPQDRCFHCADFRFRQNEISATDRVVVIGGGQSGGEVIQSLLARDNAPTEIRWLSRRHNFEPINETPFSNQVFSPEYVAAYRTLSEMQKAKALEDSVLTSDGLSLSTIDAIYRSLYRLRHIEGSGLDMAMLPNRNVASVTASAHGELTITAQNHFDGGMEVFKADKLILATGYRFELPQALAPLSDRLAYDSEGRAIPGDDYALHWDGPANARIYAQNAGRFSHGIADSQLSLMAWRSATILNSLMDKTVFELDLPDPVLAWTSLPDAAAQPQAQSANILAAE